MTPFARQRGSVEVGGVSPHAVVEHVDALARFARRVEEVAPPCR